MTRQPLLLTLNQEQKEELENCRERHPKPYLRERAAALLKIAAGQVPLQVAQKGLLKTRDPDTVYAWLKRYQQQGIAGLVIQAGRGRKPAFFPSVSRGNSGQTKDFTSD